MVIDTSVIKISLLVWSNSVSSSKHCISDARRGPCENSIISLVALFHIWRLVWEGDGAHTLWSMRLGVMVPMHSSCTLHGTRSDGHLAHILYRLLQNLLFRQTNQNTTPSENGMARQETHQKGNTWCGFEWLLNVKVCVWTHTAHTFSGLLCIWHWAANAETPTLWRTPQCSDPCKTKYICDRILSFVTFHYLWQDAAVRMLHTGDTTASTAPSFAGRPRRSWRCLVIAYHHFNNRTP